MPDRRKAAGRHIPRSVARSLLKHGAQGAKKVVVVFRRGIPSRVFGYEEHQRIVALPKEVEPWRYRQAQTGSPDPLGAVGGRLLAPLSRQAIYEQS